MALVLLALVPCLTATTAARSQEVCGSAIAACDLQTDTACLERVYACGEYDTVIRTLFVEDLAPTPTQTYFIGASFFGNYVRTRATGLQCEMATFARDYLTDYLTQVDDAFAKEGSFGPAQAMDRIYHSTQMLETLSEVSGCPESALTRARVITIARGEGVDFAKSVFLNPPSEVQALYTTLSTALRSFVSRASDLETGIALRRIELQSANSHLGSIRTVFGEVFGPVSGSGASIVLNTSVLDELERNTAGMLRDVEIEEANFAAALGGVSAEEYAALRSETITTADAFINEGALHINMIGLLLPTDPASPFWQLVDEVRGDAAAGQALDDLDQIGEDWAAFGAATGICAQPGASDRVWYCR